MADLPPRPDTAGAELVVAICGDIMAMPRQATVETIGLDDDGQVVGLF